MSNEASPLPMTRSNIFQAITKLIVALWVFSAPIIIHILVILAFCFLPQGRDVVSCASESWTQILTSGLSIVFWSYVTWYSSRLMAYARDDIYQSEEMELGDRHKGLIRPLWLLIPRLLGYSCYTIAIVMILRMSRLFEYDDSKVLLIAILACIITSLFLFFAFAKRIENLKWNFSKNYRKHITGCLAAYVIIIVLPALNKRFFEDALLQGIIVTCVCLFTGQVLFLFILSHRQEWMTAMKKHQLENKRNRALTDQNKSNSLNRLKRILLKLNIRILLLVTGKKHRLLDKYAISQEARFLYYYNILALICIVVFILAFSYPGLARAIGSLAIVIIGLSLILGLCNIILIVSIQKKVKIFAFLLVISFVFGFFLEPHKIKLMNLESNQYDQRQTVKEYLTAWIKQHESDFATGKNVPMYFVMSNGGASRSGYWAANVLNELDSITERKFSKHLFCLSGASGGSVGNAAYFAQLFNYNTTKNPNKKEEAQNYLGADFLSFTAAKMLGPDIINMIFSAPFNDRAFGLQRSMQEVKGSKELSNAFASPFSKYVRTKNDQSQLPILFINSTRMQDGKPAVYSTIAMHKDYTERLDMCSEMPTDKDVSLAAAVINGARFPYVSPAGALKDKNGKYQYYVDGGYFDNSGAGITHELLQEVLRLLETDTSFEGKRNQIVMRVIHITNSEWSSLGYGGNLKKATTLKNDIAAPLVTIFGSYSMQTSVNDKRLENFLSRSQKHKDQTYLSIHLLKDGEDGKNFTMNWVISDYIRKKMDERLKEKSFTEAAEVIKSDFK